MAKHEVSKLTGPALDLAVAKALGYPIFNHGGEDYSNSEMERAAWEGTIVVATLSGKLIRTNREKGLSEEFSPSSSWAQGGPIIERTGMHMESNFDGETNKQWWAAIMEPTGGWISTEGQTLLIAAMRCFVASRFGETIELPELPEITP